MRVWAVLPPVLLLLGALAIGVAVARGTAGLAVVVVVPVFYGSSALFLAGVLLLAAGLLTLPLSLPGAIGSPESEPASAEGASPGGLILIGPIPIFWGSWRRTSRGVRVAAALAGAAAILLGAAWFAGWIH
jgi:uncharacterized membrane protein